MLEEALLNRKQLARRLNVHVNTVDNLRRTDPTFPHPVRLSKKAVRWFPEEVDRWLRNRTERVGVDVDRLRSLAEEVA